MTPCDVLVGIIPAGRPLCSSLKAPVERGWMCKWLNDTEYHGHSAASYLCKTQTQKENKTPHKQAYQSQCHLHVKGFHNYVIIRHLDS